MLSGGIANLNVGTPETPFDVHVELLCDASPYFDKLFDNCFATVSAASVSFPDHDPDTFAEFLKGVYWSNFPRSPTSPFDRTTATVDSRRKVRSPGIAKLGGGTLPAYLGL